MASFDFLRNADNARLFDEGQTVFTAGESGDEMFVVLEGAAEVIVNDHLAATLGPGEIVGEMALIDDHHIRSADVRAASPLKVAPIDRRQFEFLLRNHPSFGIEIMKTMADRLRNMNASHGTLFG